MADTPSPLNRRKARAWMDGFTTGAIFFGVTLETFRASHVLMDEIRRDVQVLS